MSDNTVTERYDVVGMTCQHCVGAVSSELSALRGVRQVSVDLDAGTASVVSDHPLDRDAVADAIEEAGYALADDGTRSGGGS